MANTTKTHPYLSKISYSSDGITYTDLTNMKMIAPPDLDKGDAKVTCLDSTNKMHEYIASWRELGEVSFDFWYDTTEYNTLLGFWNSDTIYFWKITLPLAGSQVTNATLVFKGYLKKLKLSEASVENDDAFSCPAVIKLATGTSFAYTAAT